MRWPNRLSYLLLMLLPSAATFSQTAPSTVPMQDPSKVPVPTLPVDVAPAGSRGSIDVYLIGGQSNATGQGYLKNLPKDFKIDTSVLLFNSGRTHQDRSGPEIRMPDGGGSI